MEPVPPYYVLVRMSMAKAQDFVEAEKNNGGDVVLHFATFDGTGAILANLLISKAKYRIA